MQNLVSRSVARCLLSWVAPLAQPSRGQHPLLKWGIAGAVAIALPITPPAVAARNDYEVCAADLQGAGITPETIAAACGTALYPRELSTCVVRIRQRTNIAAEEVLPACGQVRRPLEMATCVVRIRQQTTGTTVPEVIDSCQRSLLPDRFSECVVGLNSQTNIGPTRAIGACLDGRDRPRALYPLGLPQDRLPVTPGAEPVQPLSPNPIVP